MMLQREIQALESAKLSHVKQNEALTSDLLRGTIMGLELAIQILRNFEEADMDAMAAHYDQ